MTTKKVIIKNESGIHTRPAAAIVKAASRFQSDFYIERDGIEVNGKSIISILALAIPINSRLLLKATGSDEKEAIETLSKLLQSYF